MSLGPNNKPKTTILQSIGWKFLLTENFFKQKIFGGGGEAKFVGGGGFWGFWGAQWLHRGSRGVGRQYNSSYDHDPWPAKILEWSGLAVKSNHLETLAVEEVVLPVHSAVNEYLVGRDCNVNK